MGGNNDTGKVKKYFGTWEKRKSIIFGLIKKLAAPMVKNGYGEYLLKLVQEEKKVVLSGC
jgi:hypothetical protein